ncbi:MAG: thioredoxin family protein [Bacteroidetes bacterium]|nr:thioredoxin family protein [Bacteroidota bacterium]
MKTKLNLLILLTFAIIVSLSSTVMAQNSTVANKSVSATVQKKDAIKYKVTFIELGSVRCIPCQKMQAVIKSIEQKYGKQVKTIFYDVWTPEGKLYGDKYGVKSIPTQVFLDENRKEFYRHVGYFPEEELIKVLKSKGVK